MKPLDTLIRLNEDQISGLDVTTVADNFTDQTTKRDWWNERQNADDQLQYLVEDVEAKYFSSDCVRRMFAGGEYDDEDDISSLVWQSCLQIRRRIRGGREREV